MPGVRSARVVGAATSQARLAGSQRCGIILLVAFLAIVDVNILPTPLLGRANRILAPAPAQRRVLALTDACGEGEIVNRPSGRRSRWSRCRDPRGRAWSAACQGQGARSPRASWLPRTSDRAP